VDPSSGLRHRGTRGVSTTPAKPGAERISGEVHPASFRCGADGCAMDSCGAAEPCALREPASGHLERGSRIQGIDGVTDSTGATEPSSSTTIRGSRASARSSA